MRAVTDQDQAGTGQAEKTTMPAPVTSSEEAQRPPGVAFNVKEGAELPGVPMGGQTPKNPDAVTTVETGAGVGLAVPGDPRPEPEEPSGGQSA